MNNVMGSSLGVFQWASSISVHVFEKSVEVAPVEIIVVSESPVILHSVRAGGVANAPDSS